MTETTRRVECSAATVYLAFELGSTKWTLAFGHAGRRTPRLRTIPAGAVGQLRAEITQAAVSFGVAPDAPVQSCYEAGRDGFWLHLVLEAEGALIVPDGDRSHRDPRGRPRLVELVADLGVRDHTEKYNVDVCLLVDT